MTELNIKNLTDDQIVHVLTQVIEFLKEKDPKRTLTARQLIQPTILELEQCAMQSS